MTFTVTARYVVKEGRLDEVVNLMSQVREASLREPGCNSYQLHRSIDDDNVVFIVENYNTPADFDHHVGTIHFRELVVGQIVPLLDDRLVTKGVPLTRGRW